MGLKRRDQCGFGAAISFWRVYCEYKKHVQTLLVICALGLVIPPYLDFELT
jgi:hypothetical protein